MLASVYLLLLAVGLYASKLAIIDRRAELLTSGVAGLVVFPALTFASFSVQPAFAPTTSVTMRTMGWICMGAAALNYVVFLLAGLGKLPDTTEESTNDIRH